MDVTINIKKFLEHKLVTLSVTRKDLALACNIPYRTICYILNCEIKNLELINIIKIATYFDCSINDVIAVEPKLNSKIYTSFVDISDALQNYNNNLRDFLIQNMQKHKLNPYLLARNLGFNDSIIARFINDNKLVRTLTTPVVIAISQYFNTPIDIMIGRAIKCEDNVV